jgi:hypothetical protein
VRGQSEVEGGYVSWKFFGDGRSQMFELAGALNEQVGELGTVASGG